MCTRYNQQGFTAVEVVLVVALVAAIGAAGFFALSASKKSNSATPSPPPKSSVSATPVASSTPSTSYLSVKEWGVRVPQQPSGNVLSYQISNGTATFVSSEQKALGGYCGTFNSARYHVSREPKGYQIPADNYDLKNDVSQGQTVTVGDYTYYISLDMTGGWCEAGNPPAGTSMPQAEKTANDNLLIDLKAMVAE
jgi:hypothetical protein